MRKTAMMWKLPFELPCESLDIISLPHELDNTDCDTLSSNFVESFIDPIIKLLDRLTFSERMLFCFIMAI